MAKVTLTHTPLRHAPQIRVECTPDHVRLLSAVDGVLIVIRTPTGALVHTNSGRDRLSVLQAIERALRDAGAEVL